MDCKNKCGGSKKALTEEQKKVLKAMAGLTDPSPCKDIAAAAGLESKSVSCRLRSLKNKGYVDSPQRCRYMITEAGRSAAADAE
ncbi:MAG TPA: hypothetical protein EYP57_09880 [Thermodesulfobacteriaceae bacterium]|nr:hypothetical protein [Thermodesulfobacteriaceae bacterium]